MMSHLYFVCRFYIKSAEWLQFYINRETICRFLLRYRARPHNGRLWVNITKVKVTFLEIVYGLQYTQAENIVAIKNAISEVWHEHLLKFISLFYIVAIKNVISKVWHEHLLKFIFIVLLLWTASCSINISNKNLSYKIPA